MYVGRSYFWYVLWIYTFIQRLAILLLRTFTVGQYNSVNMIHENTQNPWTMYWKNFKLNVYVYKYVHI